MPAWTDEGIGNTRQKDPRLDELIDMVKAGQAKFKNYRAIGAAHFFGEHWIEVFNKEGKPVRFRKLCTAYNEKAGEFNGKCGWCDIVGSRASLTVLQNVIDRELQKSEPKKLPKLTKAEKAGTELVLATGEKLTLKLKERGSDAWTPVLAYRFPTSAQGKIADLVALNRKKDKKSGEEKTFGPEDVKHGFDLQIKHDQNKSPSDQYNVQKGENTPLTEAEQEYLLQNIWVEAPKDKKALEKMVKASEKEAQELLDRGVLVERDDKGNVSNEPGAGKKGGKKAKKDPDYLGGIGDDDDLEDKKSKKGKGKKSKDADPEPEVKSKKDKKKSKVEDEPAPKGKDKKGKKEKPEPEDDPPVKSKKDKGGKKSKDEPADEPAKGKKDKKKSKKSDLDLD